MGNKKKRNRPNLEELLQRPWCYYCERDFDDLKILIDHQRAKHFKCERCGRRLNTAGGLSVHMNQVHKETLTSIDNALPNRSNLDVEIFGAVGIPADVVEQHRQRVVTQFAQAEADRRAATGNPPAGAAVGSESASKKVKTEKKDDIKKRMAEFKAKKAAESQQATNSPLTPATPDTQMAAQQTHGAHGAFVPGASSFGNSFQPPAQTFSPPPSAPGFNPPNNPAFGVPQGFPGGFPPGQFGNGQMPGGFHEGGPRVYGAGSPPMPYGQQGQFQPPQMQTSLPVGPPASSPVQIGLSSPPGLPQRPAFGAPPVNAATMQQMHQGQIPPQPPAHGIQANGSINASHGATPNAQTPVPETKASTPVPNASKADGEQPAGKKSKKDDKNIRMVYADNETSPEEKMAAILRYTFIRDDQPEEYVQQIDDEMRGALSSVPGGME